MGVSSATLRNWYTGDPNFDLIQAIELAFVSTVPLGAILNIKAPYGKHSSDQLGSVQLNQKLGWWLMELPATAVFLLTYLLDKPKVNSKMSKFLASLFVVHYAYRGWYFPLNIRVAKGSKSSFNIVVSLTGAFFTALHGHLHARLYRSVGTHLTDAWAKDPRFLVGFGIYELAFWTMVHSDSVMRNLRSVDGSGPRYKIPRGGMFEYVTSPQYFGEITAFGGLAIMNWSLPGLAVFLITAFNLIPRSFQNHRWYLEKFGDEYAKLGRKNLIPFLL